MSVNVKNDPDRATLIRTIQNIDRALDPRRSLLAQRISDMPSLSLQDAGFTSQDNSPLDSSTYQGHGSPSGTAWALNDVDILDDVSSANAESPEVRLLSLSLSQQTLPSTVGPSDVMYHTGVDFTIAPDMTDSSELGLSPQQGFHRYSPLVDFAAFDNDACIRNGVQPHVSDCSLSASQRSYNDDSQFIASNETWDSMVIETGSYQRNSPSQLSSNTVYPMPASPPLTESGNDISISPACSHSGYPTFMVHEDTSIESVTSAAIAPVKSGDTLFPVSPPSNAEDCNRTLRPPRQARRQSLRASGLHNQIVKNEHFQPLPTKGTAGQGSKDTELRHPRDHPYYSLQAHNDGKYHCPFNKGDKPCSHPPTTQKCAYHKYLDSHLKPYRCKVATCQEAQLQFSSNACLFRHEREAHGLHGHGDNPHRCFFEGCDRSIPGYGFPRRWNLFDHMRRVHDYAASERLSSPEASSVSSQVPKKRDSSSRKKRANGVSGAQVMKRTKPVNSHTAPIKTEHRRSNNGQRLLAAERDYYSCRSRLLRELSNITPKDSTMHEKVNESIQELMTLGLEYRNAEASLATGHGSRPT